MEERIQKLISAAGIASRRSAEELIRQGKVRVNGNTARIGDTADLREDVIEVNGVRMKGPEEKRYIMLNKPRGFVTTLSDEQNRRTAAELVADCGVRVYPVGRLDLASEGLLLMTNDGELANRLMHPRNGIEKTYLVWTTGYMADSLERLRRPIELDGRPITEPKVALRSEKDGIALWEITIHEGRNRQIRRMCEAADLRVTRLRRISEGPLKLGNLRTGAWRELSEEEIRLLTENSQ